MGGFAFDSSMMRVNILPDNKTRVTLTPHGLKLLAKVAPEVFPSISKEAIIDKSKSNGLVKLLICAQALWFSVEFLGRMFSSTAVSLLELNTLVHALFCLVAYIGWWNKPLDIKEPVLIPLDQEIAKQVCAWMVMTSTVGAVRPCRPVEPYPEAAEDQELQVTGVLIHVKAAKEAMNLSMRILDSSWDLEVRWRYRDVQYRRRGKEGVKDEKVMTLELYDCLHGFGFVTYHHAFKQGFNRYIPFRQLEERIPDGYSMCLSEQDIYCMELASKFARGRLLRVWYDRRPDDLPGLPMEDYVVPRSPNTPRERQTGQLKLSLKQQFMMKLFRIWYEMCHSFASSAAASGLQFNKDFINPILYWIVALSVISSYGGIHLFAWNGPFRTLGETRLWRYSGILTASPVALLLAYLALLSVWALFWKLIHWPGMYLARLRASETQEASYDGVRDMLFYRGRFPFLALVCIYAIAMLLARFYIVVQSFVTLAYLPEEVYEVPSWIQFFPHFGSG